MLSLADAILEEKIDVVKNLLQHGTAVNDIDEYGFSPLIESAIANNFSITKILIKYGADPNQIDMLGGTALHWAAENNNILIAQLLLEKGADPNAYNFTGQPILVMPLLRQQHDLKKLLLKFGADLNFAQDYINTKLLGHMFELVGTADIIDPKNNFVEVDFEGFFLEVSLGIIADSLAQFKNHFAGRQLRRYINLFQVVIDVIYRASQLIKYQQYQVNIEKYQTEIHSLIEQEPLIIPIGYEGHAITLIKLGDILVKCDRREDSRHYDNIMIYQMRRSSLLNTEFIKKLIYEKQSDHFINEGLSDLLDLQPITELKVRAQISGNCSWANVEACIPALFFLLFSSSDDFSENISRYKNLVLSFFGQWREWNKDRSLQFCIQSFKQSDSIRKACKAEILAAILFQSCGGVSPIDSERAESILNVITMPEYDHVLQNYIRSYCYEDYSEEGQNFLRLLRNYGYKI
ncbi:MAG TPA: Dot/Icm T4SS effector AnkH/LegA3 [Gammaproteobacteria bacterium]|nr:Dot/Icm T4SS effector AnkH/LegA3 [Gammaproteobacteria bacterium]